MDYKNKIIELLHESLPRGEGEQFKGGQEVVVQVVVEVDLKKNRNPC